MKSIFFKAAIAGVLTLGMASCADELNISSVDPQSFPSYEEQGLFAKMYGSLCLTGQKGETGNGDITTPEDKSGFYRTVFNLEELPTDEINWAWQTDTGIPQITGISWNSTTEMIQWCYNRLGWNITLYNFYLQETAGNDADEIKTKRAEVRFLRALNYYYYLDLFHKAPFKDETNAMDELPTEKVGKDLYEWIDNELTEVEKDLDPMGQNTFEKASTHYGRADKGAAYMLHARLALNSEVYTDGAVKDYQKAIDYSDLLIGGPYALSKVAKIAPNGLTYSGYAQLFMADNDENAEAMKEIILPIRQDGLRARSTCGTKMLVNSMRISGMPYAGVKGCWSCIYARPNLVEFFFPTDNIPMSKETVAENTPEEKIIELDAADGSDTKSILAAAGDDRALFYAGRGGAFASVRKLRADKLNNFLDGVSIVKWQNIRTDGKTTSDADIPDTDIPYFRLAEAYLTRAEAKWRLGKDGLDDVNELRKRAGATVLSELDANTLLQEWGREFYTEGRRRSDLIRFNKFTGNSYLWAWKGGVATGAPVDAHYAVFPIPLDDINNNHNMHQNKGY